MKQSTRSTISCAPAVGAATLVRFLFVLAWVAEPAGANHFLSHTASNSSHGINELPTEQMRQAILAEIDGALGNGNHKVSEARVAKLEGVLSHMLAALPKNEHGKFGHAVVRYALHRLFVQQHGWFVRGLEPDGASWNASSPLEALRGGVPEYVQGLFERRLGEGGAEPHDVAILAAILENMAHQEAIERLKESYSALGFAIDGYVHGEAMLGRESVMHVLDVYMGAYVLGEDLTVIPPGEALARVEEAGAEHPSWEETRAFVRRVLSFHDVEQKVFSFPDVLDVVSTVSERYGHFQDQDCKKLKKELLAIEDDGAGRVQLTNFYKHALETGDLQFTESVPYLRQLGALDESDPQNLRIIVSNYILSPSNCMASSSYYSVCCMDECEDLLGHLEMKIQAPDASIWEILAIVAGLPSASMPANRTLSSSLIERLSEIAQSNGGRVPLHGRLFAQWMHHAYPRECPFPHLSGTTAPRREEDYCKADDGCTSAETQAEASEEAMMEFLDDAAAKAQLLGLNEAGALVSSGAEQAELAPWIHEEELVHALASKAPASRFREGATALFFVALVALTTSLRSGSTGLLLFASSAKGSSEDQAKFSLYV